MRATPARLASLLALGVVLLYARTLGWGFVWDDPFFIADAPSVVQGAPLSDYFLKTYTTSSRDDYNARIYRPMRQLTFRATAVVAGRDPFAFRVVCLASYTLSVVLVFFLLLRISGRLVVSGWAAAIWAVMPVHVEVATFSSATADTLSLNFELAAILVVLAMMKGRFGTPTAAVVSSVLLLLSMLAKEMAMTGFVLVVWLLFLMKHRTRRELTVVATMVFTTLGYLVLRTMVLRRVGQEDFSGDTFLSGLATAPVLILYYAKLVLMPIGHHLGYVIPDRTVGVVALAVAGVAVVTGGVWLLDRRLNQTSFRMGFGWFLIALLPVLHLVPLWTFLADRFALVPSVGVALLFAAACTVLVDRYPRALSLGCSILVLLYAGGTLAEQSKWESDATLYSHDVRMAPRSDMAQSNYCTLMLEMGEAAKALDACDAALQLGRNRADVNRRRAVALELLGRFAEAETAIESALQQDATEPGLHAMRGGLALRQGAIVRAREFLKTAQQREADQPGTLLLQARIAVFDRDLSAAKAAFNHLLQRHGNVARFHYNAGQAALELGDRSWAKDEARACQTVAPNDVLCRDLAFAIDR
jgi:protein O-mannosyl-transferase